LSFIFSLDLQKLSIHHLLYVAEKLFNPFFNKCIYFDSWFLKFDLWNLDVECFLNPISKLLKSLAICLFSSFRLIRYFEFWHLSYNIDQNLFKDINNNKQIKDINS
jgi:hypothetical protein